jgi:hypothetical protein
MVHLVVEPDSASWLRWAVGQNVHPAVMGFIRAQPHLLCASTEDLAGERALLPSPRSWKRISDVMKLLPGTSAQPITRVARIAIEGIIGLEHAAAFFSLAEQLVALPPIDALLDERDPNKVAGMLPKSVDVLYTLGYALAANFTPETISDVFRVINIIGTSETSGCGPEVAVLTGALCSQRAMDLKIAAVLGRSREFRTFNERFLETNSNEVAA